MKDITDYFSSPTKIQKNKEGPEEAKVVKKSPNQNVNNQNKDKVGENSSTNNKQEDKKTKRKRKRKPTDPEVKNVTELFSSNFKLKSPNAEVPSSSNKSPLKEKQESSDAKNTKENSEDVGQPNNESFKKAAKNDFETVVVEDSDVESNTPKAGAKVNAFQFLMNSRNNIIGQNSSDDTMVPDTKEKREARKNLFQNWADQKGATKRKREDEEIEKCINVKMEERAKRLKNMLTSGKIEEQSSSTNTKRKVIRKQTKIKKLSSSNSENSNDSNDKKSVEVESPVLDKLTEVLVDNAQDIIISNSSQSPKKNFKEQNKNNLLSFIGVITKDKEQKLEVYEDSPSKQPTKEFIKIKMFSPVKKKRSILSLKKTESVDSQLLNESSQESVKIKKHKKKKKHKVVHDEDVQNGKVRETKNEESVEAKLNHSASDFVSPKTQKVKNNIKIGSLEDHPNPENFEDKKSQANAASEGRVLRKRNPVNYSDLFKAEIYKESKETPKTGSSKKNKKLKYKDDSVEKIELLSDSDCEEATSETNVKKLKTPLKVAPVFLKVTPKPKIDQETMEARKKFLLSGIPDSLKRTVEKQKSIEEKDYDFFPTISHVQQRCDSSYWSLPRPEFKLTEKKLLKITEEMLVCHNLITRQLPYELNFNSQTKKNVNMKTELDRIKLENPDYPVYKVFRHVYEKNGKNLTKEPGKARKSPRKKGTKRSRSSSESKSKETEPLLTNYEMWTEKYKPKCSEEILGNHKGVTALKKFLETWMHYSEEINARGKRNRRNSNSESEFESTDCDSRDSVRLPGNTIILGGPAGSGKTNAVYAIASELGFNILELNASSKRTGKRLIQELQEATQSHQVRKKNIQEQSMANFMNSKKVKDSEDKDHKKMCILLVEDIDLVFDQDEGFLSSLTQLITTSKRPIVMTTTDTSPPHVQKFMSQHEFISFMPLSLHCLGVWLQVVCLAEGLLVDKNDVGNLLEYNKGDIRKTLLEVQFWTQSGGQLERNSKVPLKSVANVCSLGNGEFKSVDEDLTVTLKDVNTKEEAVVHRHCLGGFINFRGNKEYNLPKQFDLGCLWWNIPNILNAPSCAGERLNREVKPNGDIECTSKAKLKLVGDIYDSLVLSDCLLATVGHSKSCEPIVKEWEIDIRETLELSEREDGKDVFLDPVSDLVHSMLDRRIDYYRKSEGTDYCLNLALPDSNERRWRAKQHMCEAFLKEPIPTCNILDRKSIALDYLPALRHIARLEDKRAASNTKRGNRFRHYMKNLNMTFKESTCKMACNILFLDED